MVQQFRLKDITNVNSNQLVNEKGKLDGFSCHKASLFSCNKPISTKINEIVKIPSTAKRKKVEHGKKILQNKKAKIVKSANKSKLETNLDFFISRMSIKAYKEDVSYYLPFSKEIGCRETNDAYYQRFIKRRNENRKQVMKDIEMIRDEIRLASTDAVNGEMYFLSTLNEQQELDMRLNPLGKDFLSGTNMTPTYRTKLLDKFLVNFFEHEQLKMLDSANLVFKAIPMFDRYLKVTTDSLPRSIHLILYSCFYLAAKIQSQEAGWWIGFHMKHFSEAVILFESHLIQVLDSYLLAPTATDFVAYFVKDSEIRQTATDIIYFCYLTYELAGHPAQVLAAAACCMASMLHGNRSWNACWTSSLQFFTGLSLADLKPLIQHIIREYKLGEFSQNQHFVYRCNNIRILLEGIAGLK